MAVEVQIPNAVGEVRPARGVVVMALPYDRDSILTSLENEAPAPRPPTAQLDSLFQLYRGPFAAATRLAARAGRWRDSVRTLEAAAADSSVLATLRDTLTAVESAAAAAATRLAALREQLSPRIDSLRLLMRRWEEEAFGRYGEITASLTGNRLTATIADTTSADGTIRLWLPPGGRSWWIHARSFNSGDPNSEWYWNLPLTGATVVLDSSNARLRPRY